MKVYTVKTDVAHFNWIKDIQHDISKLSTFFRNPNMVITEEEFEEFNHRYLEVESQLNAWHSSSLKRIQLLKGENK